MAERPVFIPDKKNYSVLMKSIDFKWNPGFSKSQKFKNVKALHDRANEIGIYPLLEISTKSDNEIGIKLSAFNLHIKLKNGKYVSVESAFQSSKVFKSGEQYLDLLYKTARQIKKDDRIKKSGNLKCFIFENEEWELEPKSAFYDWLYLNALLQNHKLSEHLIEYNGFTDIEFNPRKQINCQARSAALFVSLFHNKILNHVLQSKSSYIQFLLKNDKNSIMKINKKNIQGNLFG